MNVEYDMDKWNAWGWLRGGGFAESLKIFYTRWVCTDELTHGYGGIVIGYK